MNPNRYGVLEESNSKPIKVHEKPIKFISNNAVVGIYMYSSNVVKLVKNLQPSSRGELEITDLNNIYIKNDDCDIIHLENKSVWFDSGTFDDLLKASNYVKSNC